MTEMPQSDPTPEAPTAPGQDETPEVVFTPYLPSTQPPPASGKPWMILAGCLLLVVAGVLFWPSGPDKAQADNTPPDVTKMTPQQLAEDASMLAARELIHRLHTAPPAERSAVARAMDNPKSARLRRNLAMAMALEQQKRAQENNLRMRREMREAEEGF